MSASFPAQAEGFQIRVSGRARRPRISVDPHGRATVVLPQGFDPGLATELVAERAEWIHSARAKMAERYPGSGQTGLPETLHLAATGESFALRHSPAAGAPAVRESTAGVLLLRGPGRDSEAARLALLAWLARHLRPWAESRLAKIGEPHGLSPSKVALRSQRTRWGSCSATGTISINVRTAFLDARLADYVVAHELAHLAEMSHSPAFWHRVESIMPGAAKFDRELTRAGRSLPGWLL
ncbi:MAG: SprT family zinc-dependent metalloprotease [Actinomycetota bacterium]|nr:SprT family zinc-dependent metalloprotease [Actinomycetota bacterium]